MATVTKTEIFQKIREYNESNERKCPSKELVKLFGKLTITERKGLEALIKNLKDSGELLSKKGRGGGLYLSPTVDNVEAIEPEIVDEDSEPITIEASPVEIEDSNIGTIEPDHSDESYNRLMDMVSGRIETDEVWVKTNWPDAWDEMGDVGSDDIEDDMDSASV